MSETILEVPQGRFDLRLRPHRPRSPMRAWDSADVQLLHRLADEGLPQLDGRVLIVADAGGALTVALAPWRPTLWLDSMVSVRTIEENRARNDHAPGGPVVPSTEQPDGPFDLVVVKLPRSTDLLADLLGGIAPHVATDGRVFLAGMDKHLRPGIDDAVRAVFGSCARGRAWRRSRVLSTDAVSARRASASVPAGSSAHVPTPFPVTGEDCPLLGDARIEVHSRPGVFASGRLDVGTRLLLGHLPEPESGARVVDLGCGSGVLGTALAVARPDLDLVFTDESARAVAATAETWTRSCGERAVSIEWTDAGAGIADASVDAVVTNPPFHDEGTVDPGIGRWFVREAHRILRPGGTLTIVANRHLGHHVTMSRRFGGVATIASNRKFVVLRSTR